MKRIADLLGRREIYQETWWQYFVQTLKWWIHNPQDLSGDEISRTTALDTWLSLAEVLLGRVIVILNEKKGACRCTQPLMLFYKIGARYVLSLLPCPLCVICQNNEFQKPQRYILLTKWLRQTWEKRDFGSGASEPKYTWFRIYL